MSRRLNKTIVRKMRSLYRSSNLSTRTICDLFNVNHNTRIFNNTIWRDYKYIPKARGPHPHTKLTYHKAEEIRALHSKGVPLSSLALKYGVSRKTIYKIIRGQTWKEINNMESTPIKSELRIVDGVELVKGRRHEDEDEEMDEATKKKRIEENTLEVTTQSD